MNFRNLPQIKILEILLLNIYRFQVIYQFYYNCVPFLYSYKIIILYIKYFLKFSKYNLENRELITFIQIF